MIGKQAAAFYSSHEWRVMRARIVKRDEHRCVWCGADVSGFKRSRVDHIVPISHAWHLRLDEINLRTLCITCDNRRHAEKGRGVPVYGCDATGNPRDPAHWWNR